MTPADPSTFRRVFAISPSSRPSSCRSLSLPDARGELVWTEGGRHLITIGDIQRAKDEGFFEGDPTGVFLEGPFFGEAPPGWVDLLNWLSAIGSGVSGIALLTAFIRRRYEQWKGRGAVTPFAFLDLIVARDEWKQEHLARLLGVTDQEASDLLTSMDSSRPATDGRRPQIQRPRSSGRRLSRTTCTGLTPGTGISVPRRVGRPSAQLHPNCSSDTTSWHRARIRVSACPIVRIATALRSEPISAVASIRPRELFPSDDGTQPRVSFGLFSTVLVQMP